jgi:hypothetical protein
VGIERSVTALPALPYSGLHDELTFDITQEPDGGFVAEALGENIVTQADTWDQLRENVLEAVALYFDNQPKPATILLDLRKDEVLVHNGDIMNLTAHLQHLEGRLLDPAVRSDPAQLAALLADDFREFGSSGRSYTKAEILAHLTAEPSDAFSLSLNDFAVQLLAPGVALATYRSTRRDHATGETTEALRSSIWTLQNDTWQMRFHQGTRAPIK